MTKEFLYWLLMFLWVIFGGWYGVATPGPGRYPFLGWGVVIFLLFLIIGLSLYGAPIRG